MNFRLLPFGIISSIILLSSSCKKNEEEMFTTPYAKIKGTWKIERTQAFGYTFPGDGSSLTFNDCSSAPCSGNDYLASSKTSGNFSYTFASDQKSITIVDNSGDGGAYNGKWDIVSFENNKLKITSQTILGQMTIELNK
jgi:hypothetical protein